MSDRDRIGALEEARALIWEAATSQAQYERIARALNRAIADIRERQQERKQP